MKTIDVGSLLVKDRGDIVEIVAETDIVHKVVAAHKNPKDTSIESVMSFPLMTVEADTGIEQAGEYYGEEWDPPSGRHRERKGGRTYFDA